MSPETRPRDEDVSEKPAPSRPERTHDTEEDTVVLGGDTPISFDKALGQEPKRIQPPADAEIKYDRRDAQRAALDERERLRALFESAKPEELLLATAGETEGEDTAAPAPATAKARNTRRGRPSKVKESLEPVAPISARPVPLVEAFEPEPAAAPPVFNPSLVADLALPVRRPKLTAAPAVIPEVAPAEPKAGRAKGKVKAPAVPKVDALELAKLPKPTAKKKPVATPVEAPAKVAKPVKRKPTKS